MEITRSVDSSESKEKGHREPQQFVQRASIISSYSDRLRSAQHRCSTKHQWTSSNPFLDISDDTVMEVTPSRAAGDPVVESLEPLHMPPPTVLPSEHPTYTLALLIKRW